jgi:hypothetical protein
MGEARQHEAQDLSIRAIVIFAAALAAFGAVSHVLLVALFDRYRVGEERRDTPPPPLRESRVTPPPPRLQENPGVDLREFRRREDEILRTYGWVDRNHGVLRIPIDRAMKLIAERGLPSRSAQRTAD